tara:strand:- start:25 stop:201 length:177 start_codon:yes stop_codon:yes gene_type:complete
MSRLDEVDLVAKPNARIIRSVNVSARDWKSMKSICDKYGYKMSRVFGNVLSRWIRDKS